MAINSTLNSSIAVALSGLNASAKRVNVSASNIVGAVATDALPSQESDYVGYKPLEFSFSSNNGGGVTGVVTKKSPPYIEGLNFSEETVAFPNVNIAEELIKMKMGKNSYQANIQTIKTIDNMSKTLIDIIS